MEFKDKINQSVAAAVAKIMEKTLHPNQQKLDVHEPEKDKLTADDFKKLRAGKKPDMKKEEAEHVDENSGPRMTDGQAGGLGNNPHLNDLHRPAKAAPSYIKQQLLARKAKGGVAGPKGKLPEEVEQVDEAKKESKEDFDARQKRLVAAGNETAKDPERLKKLSKIPGYSAAMNLAKKSTNEEVEQLDEYTPGPDGKTMIKGRAYGASKPKDDYIKGPSDAELKKIEAEKKKKPVTEEHGSAPKKRGMMGLKAYLTSKKSE